MTGLEVADRLPGFDRVTGRDDRDHRFVGRTQAVGMADADDPATSELAGVDDHAGPRGQDRLAGLTGEVDAAMAGQPGQGRRIEAADHRERAGQRPHPERGWRRGDRPGGHQ
jgi:hypothetical protein